MLPREINIQEGKVLSLNSVKIYMDEIILILKITIIRLFTKSSYFRYFLSLFPLSIEQQTQYSVFSICADAIGPGHSISIVFSFYSLAFSS